MIKPLHSLILVSVLPILLMVINPTPILAQGPGLDLRAEPLSNQYGIQLSWNQIAEGDHIEIERSANGVTAWEAWGESIGNQLVDTQVACSHSYYYRARTVDAAGTAGQWSDVAEAVATPCAPIAGSVYPVPGWYILDVSWIDIAPDESTFRLERSLDGVSWNELMELPPNTRYYADRFGTPECSTVFYYRLRAERDDVFSPFTPPYSNVVSPCAPTNASAAVVQNGEHVRLSWRDNAPDETGFEVWRRSDANGTPRLVATLPAVEATGGSMTWEDDAPDCEMRNSYQVRAIRGTNSASPWEPRTPTQLRVYVPNCPAPASTLVTESSVQPPTELLKPLPIEDGLAPSAPPVSTD